MKFFSNLDYRVSSQMCGKLSQDYTIDEVKVALKQMHHSKAHGPDGMAPLFFQKYWTIVGPTTSKALLLALKSSPFPASLNHTFVTLIPKKKHFRTVMDYHPISFCNVLYKLISKVIANRIKMVLPDLISDSQSAFVLGR